MARITDGIAITIAVLGARLSAKGSHLVAIGLSTMQLLSTDLSSRALPLQGGVRSTMHLIIATARIIVMSDLLLEALLCGAKRHIRYAVQRV